MIRLANWSRHAWLLCVLLAGPAFSAELLVNGDLETAAAPLDWELETFITDSSLPVNATEQIGGAASEFEEGLGLFLRPFAGNQGDYADQNLPVNAILSQTVDATEGLTYTFSGSAMWGGDADPSTNDGYSGGVTVLSPESPSDPGMTGTVPSPTETFFELAFLDASEQVIGDPVVVDLRDDDGKVNDATWTQHMVQGVAPAGAVSVRVSAAATDMVANAGGQNAYFDTFALNDDMFPTQDRLDNGDLDEIGAPLGYEVMEVRDGTDTLFGFRDFANHTTDGQQGLWLRAFAGGDAEISQTVSAVAGDDYEFSAWSYWEDGYAGGLGDPEVETFIEMEFLGSDGSVLDAEFLELAAAGQFNDRVWRQYSVDGTAPEGTTEVRVSAGATGMYNSGFNPQSAFFDDFSLIGPDVAGLVGDYNNDGLVDARDYTLWRDSLGGDGSLLANRDPDVTGVVGAADYEAWRSNYGQEPGAHGAVAAPEPMALALVAFCGALGLAARQRR